MMPNMNSMIMNNNLQLGLLRGNLGTLRFTERQRDGNILRQRVN